MTTPRIISIDLTHLVEEALRAEAVQADPGPEPNRG